MAIDSRSWIEAVRHLQQVLELEPGNLQAKSHLEDAKRRVRASALIDEGRAAHAAERWEEAVASFREAGELDPDFADDDGLLADAAWRVDVLRQPTEPAARAPEVIPVPIPEPATVTPAAPEIQPAPTPVNAQVPAPAPPGRPPVYQRRRRTSAGLVFALVIGIGLLFAFVLAMIDEVLPVADITAQRMASPVAVNVDFSDWVEAASTLAQFQVFPAEAQSDLPSGHWWVGWDDLNLYVFVAVSDSRLEPWLGDRDQMWNGDSANFEFGRDPTGLDPSSELRADDVHVLLGPIPGQASAITAINRVANGDIVGGPDPDIEAMASIVDVGYAIEARIPWRELGVSNPVVGAVFGMNVNVSDVNGDVDDDPEPDLRVMVSNNVERVQPRPATWTTLVLGP
ncbi:MAG: sugar-binding protein [Acidimicrobiia bacterium]